MSKTDVALNNAVLILNPANRTVFVINRGDVRAYPGCLYIGGVSSSVIKMTPAERLLTLYIDAWHAIHVHGIAPQDVDAALRVVSEYKETLKPDFPSRLSRPDQPQG